MSDQRCFFFYGTLIAGSGHAVERQAHAHLVDGRAGSVKGALYVLPDPAGWYPALVAGDGLVRGRVYRAPVDFDIAALDAYEGADYVRQPVAVTCDDGAAIMAEAYIWIGNLPAGALAVPQGDFYAFAQDRGMRVYGA